MKFKFGVKTLILMSSLLLSLCGFAQTKKITGKVVTKSGAGIAGAVVKVKGTNTVTLTDDTGNFSISVKNEDAILSVTSLGFKGDEKKVGANDNVIIELTDDATQLTDVVVTAYGIRKEAKRLGYTIQEIKGSDLTKARDANPVNSLAGKIS